MSKGWKEKQKFVNCKVLGRVDKKLVYLEKVQGFVKMEQKEW